MTVEYMDDCALQEPAPSAFAGCVSGFQLREQPVASYALSTPIPEWAARAKMQLAEFSKLRDGWDSYRAKPISMAARNAAFGLLRQLTSTQTPEPALVPTADGSVQIEWHAQGIDLEIRVLSATRFKVCFEDARGLLPPIEDELQYDFRALHRAIQALSSR